MRILTSLLGKTKPKHELLGNTDPVCPYCSETLDKIPGRKKKCPHCGNYMYVRTRPSDKKRVVVTEQDAAKIDEQWMMENGTYDTYLANKREFEIQTLELTKKWGREPSEADVYWALYNKPLLEHAKKGDWGLYRNTRFNMAELLRHEKRNRPALETYLEVSYLDANGPRNMGGIFDPEVIREYPPFSRDKACQAPAIVHYIQKLSDALGMTKEDLKGIFVEVAEPTRKNLMLPVSPEQAWVDLRKELDR
jgi:DNA-directed RNA polymerase subunit RPC12/RpoP